MIKTQSYEEALSWAEHLGNIGLVAKVWIPKIGFEYAFKNSDGSVSFTRDGSPNFGLGIGPNPIIDEKWQRFSLPKALPKELTIKYKLVNQWNPYAIKTKDFEDTNQVTKISPEGIADFLNENAPNSSVYPGDPETLFWAGIKIENDLVAVGCVGKWESGNYVISSIATKKSLRGKGFGSQITRGIVALCNQAGIEEVFLAINAKNEVAAKLYEKIGFVALGKFNTFEGLS